MNAFHLGRLLASFHPILVHVPLVLWPTATFVEILGLLGVSDRRVSSQEAGDTPDAGTTASSGSASDSRVVSPSSTEAVSRWILLGGTVIALFAFLCGIYAETVAARLGTPTEPIERHEWMAIATTWTFIALTVTRLFYVPRRNLAGGVWLMALLTGCGLLVYTGYLGGETVYEVGTAVHAVTRNFGPTPEDLQLVGMQQPIRGILYSDWMHHIFGWVVLCIALLLGLSGARALRGEGADSVQGTESGLGDVQRFIPWILMAGGLFLWIFSDWDAWPLANDLPLTDKEVFLHKLIATMLLVFGAVMARSKRPVAVALDASQERRLLAVFGIIGGALMLTHIHSVAPYSNVALGVYIHHTVIGGLALGLGGAQLASASYPRLKGAMPWLMGALALVLITYNEGLPWYLGNVAHPRPSPDHGLVTQVGALRAALRCDTSADQLAVAFYPLEQDTPAPHPPSHAWLRVEQAGVSSLVALTPRAEQPSIFEGHLPGLSRAETFLATLVVADAQGSEREAEFDPWTRPVVAWFDLNGRPAPYICPMHEQEGALNPGNCRICQMTLMANPALQTSNSKPQASAVTTQGQCTVTPREPGAGQPSLLRFTVNKPGGAPAPLRIVHEKPMHLMVVSQDLSLFDHVHPTPQEDGSLTLPYTFPEGGDYVLFAEYTPQGEPMQCLRQSLHVAGTPANAVPLVVSPTEASYLGEYRVCLRTLPTPPHHGSETVLSFVVQHQGLNVTDLEPYLGARGHLAGIDAQVNSLMHSHPVDEAVPAFGPEVRFHVRFRHAGLYKLWCQVQHHGKVITAPFVVRVD